MKKKVINILIMVIGIILIVVGILIANKYSKDTNNDNKNKRISAIYRKDKGKKRRSSYENPLIRKLYKELLVEEGSDVAKKLLHVREE